MLIVLSQGILIPIVFTVHKTNNKVLSLFGGIPIHEIKELAFKCEKYMIQFLEEKQAKEKEEGNGKKKKEENQEQQGENYIEVNNEEG